MNQNLIDSVVQAVLYEGHILYPYRPGAKRNQPQSKFGRVYPEAYSLAENGAEPFQMQTECLVEGPGSAIVDVLVRFLQPMERDIGALAAPLRKLPAPNNPDFFHVVPWLEVEGQFYQSWQEAVERTIAAPGLTLCELCAQPQEIPFVLASSRMIEPILDRSGHIAGVIVRRQEAIEGVIELAAEPADASAFKLTLRVVNRSVIPGDFLDDKDEIMMRTFTSTHAVLHAQGGKFVSLIDPAEAHAPAAAACRNIGTWPILIGEEERQQCDVMLSSPIILYDYPRIAPENSDDALDAEEIEEILSLGNITDEEKREVHSVDQRARRVFAPSGSLSDEQRAPTREARCNETALNEALFPADSRALHGRQPVSLEDQPPA